MVDLIESACAYVEKGEVQDGPAEVMAALAARIAELERERDEAVEKERAACSALAEHFDGIWPYSCVSTQHRIAAAIRARSPSDRR